MEEADGTGAVIRYYLWLGAMPVAVVDHAGASPALYYVYSDQLNRLQKMTDGTGAVAWDGVFDPFGNAVSVMGSAANLLMFPGQYYDSETQLSQNWFRDYDPTLGRYVESDPIGLQGGMNAYAYVGGDPVNRADYLGLYQCVYSITIHSMSCSPGKSTNPGFHSNHYTSGNDESPNCPDCQNNPDHTAVRNHGPLPATDYSIGPQRGLSRRRLTPLYPEEMLGRKYLELHGCPNPKTCSDGCIGATTNDVRDRLNKLLHLEEGHNTLEVLP